MVTETGITVELILGLTSEFFTDFNIYPNPTSDIINIDYDKILSDNLSMSIIDMNGKRVLSQSLERSENGKIEIDLSSYQSGQYILKFFDNDKNESALTFRILKR